MQKTVRPVVNRPSATKRWSRMVCKDFEKNKMLYLMVLPLVIYYIVWCYAPMYGIQIAFKDFKPKKAYPAHPGWDWKTLRSFFTAPSRDA